MSKYAKLEEKLESRPQRIVTPGGENLVLLSAAEYEDMLDRLDVAEAKATAKAVARGEIEKLTSAEADDYLEAKTPLAFWRNKRSLTQRELAERVAISQAYLANLENNTRKGDPQLFKRLAAALNVRMEDLVGD